MRFNKVSNEVIRGKIGVASIEDTIREVIQKVWYTRRSVDALVRRC